MNKMSGILGVSTSDWLPGQSLVLLLHFLQWVSAHTGPLLTPTGAFLKSPHYIKSHSKNRRARGDSRVRVLRSQLYPCHIFKKIRTQ